jgi:SNF2 family DNA or RNA helicase
VNGDVQGHKIKNPRTQLAQKLREIPAKLSVIISGTPIQNDLMEMHALMDFVCPVRTLAFTQQNKP